MDKKVMYAVGIVAILLAASCVVFVVNKDGGDDDTPAALKDAELKVFGNINGDRYLDEKDSKMVQQLIDDGKTAEEYPLADANQDGELDSKDVEIIDKVVKGEKTTIWHINYFDQDGDGTMDSLVESTNFPIESILFNGSSNLLIYLFCLGITDEVAGLTYGSTSDKGLFADNYFDKSKHVFLGTSGNTITFEDGKAGSTNVIAEKNVTAVISNWNRNQMSSWQDFENNGIDVVRVAASDTDRETLTHSAMLIGLLFQKVERADAYVNLNLEILDYVSDAVSKVTPIKATASSSSGNLSSPTSDYTTFILNAGAQYGLEGLDFGGNAGVKVAEHPEVYANYSFDKIIHFRTNLSYDQTPESVEKYWNEYTSKFKDWKNADSGQYLVCGTMPVCLRVAYAAVALYPDAVDIDTIDDYHGKMIKEFYNGLEFDLDSMKFLVTPADMA